MYMCVTVRSNLLMSIVALHKIILFPAERKKQLKKGKKEDTEKPDTFTEKLVSHLVKNLMVRVLHMYMYYRSRIIITFG